MLHKEFWGMLFIAFVAWVFIAGAPQDRISNFCRPLGWAGNAVTSVSALAIPSQQENVQRWFDKFEYGCRYMTWRLFYQNDYNAYIKAQQELAATSPMVPATAASASAPASAVKP
jgi:hypothetical protein